VQVLLGDQPLELAIPWTSWRGNLEPGWFAAPMRLNLWPEDLQHVGDPAGMRS
jgi:hypothetical protein